MNGKNLLRAVVIGGFLVGALTCGKQIYKTSQYYLQENKKSKNEFPISPINILSTIYLGGLSLYSLRKELK